MIQTAKLFAASLLAMAPVAARAADPAPPGLRFAFEERVDLETPEAAGEGPRGAGNRIGLLGGTVRGPRLNGTILPGGADWQLIRKDGCSEIVADYFIRADDKALIHIRNVGLGCAPDKARGAYARANPVFTAPAGPHEWLNKSVFTSTIEPVLDGNGTLRQVVLRFYEVL
ncbi:MAG: DUF3237 domain-containing protein [Novosphingobium sp.]|nr:DUF3237 domain-containing protein [Novosphingobium sp.]